MRPPGKSAATRAESIPEQSAASSVFVAVLVTLALTAIVYLFFHPTQHDSSWTVHRNSFVLPGAGTSATPPAVPGEPASGFFAPPPSVPGEPIHDAPPRLR